MKSLPMLPTNPKKERRRELIDTLRHIILNVEASNEADNMSRMKVFINRANEIADELLTKK